MCWVAQQSREFWAPYKTCADSNRDVHAISAAVEPRRLIWWVPSLTFAACIEISIHGCFLAATANYYCSTEFDRCQWDTKPISSKKQLVGLDNQVFEPWMSVENFLPQLYCTALKQCHVDFSTRLPSLLAIGSNTMH